MNKTIDKLVRNEWVKYAGNEAKLVFELGSAVFTPWWASWSLYELSEGDIRGAVGLGAIAVLHSVAGYSYLKKGYEFVKTLVSRG